MATYNKRGYKPPKPVQENEAEEIQQPVEETTFEGQSTTADVFNSLDEGASKTEAWVQKNQKVIFGALGVVVLLVVGYLLYDKVLVSPKEDEAANEMFQAEQYLSQAVNAQKSQDSLYNLALKGGEGKYGFLGIIDKYSGTDAANLAHYGAGTAYLNTGKYKEAVQYFEDFKTDDVVLKASALGATGDAFVQLGGNDNLAKGLQYYIDAAKVSDNEVYTPRFLFKAGQLSQSLNKKEDALKYYNEIKEKYSTSPEGMSIDAFIAELE